MPFLSVSFFRSLISALFSCKLFPFLDINRSIDVLIATPLLDASWMNKEKSPARIILHIGLFTSLSYLIYLLTNGIISFSLSPASRQCWFFAKAFRRNTSDENHGPGGLLKFGASIRNIFRSASSTRQDTEDVNTESSVAGESIYSLSSSFSHPSTTTVWRRLKRWRPHFRTIPLSINE